MATVRPFEGLRPTAKYASNVASPPYDVLSSSEARAEAGGNPFSFLHVGKSEIDLPIEIDIHDDRVYQKAKESLDKMIADRVLQQDGDPCFYVYSQTMGNHTQAGIVGCVSVEEYKNNIVRKHELTRPDKELDRTKHILVTRAQTGPILMAYRAKAEIDHVVASAQSAMPEYDFRASDGIQHKLWVIREKSTVSLIEKEFNEVEYLYIADGHHRSAAACRAADESAKANPRHTGKEEYNYFLAVMFPHSQLKILEYNRVVKDLNGNTGSDFLKKLERDFDLTPSASAVQPKRKGEFGLYMSGTWYLLSAKHHHLTSSDPIARLDVSILQNTLLAPVLGIDDPRTNKRIDFIGGIRGVKELEKRVNSGEIAVAFSLYPTSIEELLAIADAGKIMPPKSTWFEPKLRDGVVVHMLD